MLEIVTVALVTAALGPSSTLMVPEVSSGVFNSIDSVLSTTNIGVMRATKASNVLESVINKFSFAIAANAPCGNRENFEAANVFVKSIKESADNIGTLNFTNAQGGVTSFKVPSGLAQVSSIGAACVGSSFSVMTTDPFVPSSNATSLRWVFALSLSLLWSPWAQRL
eukprot:Opistho-2@83897